MWKENLQWETADSWTNSLKEKTSLPSSLLDITWLLAALLCLTTDLDTFFGTFSFGSLSSTT